MKRLIALAWLVAGVLALLTFAAAVGAVVVGALWWIWTQDVTAARVVATGIVIATCILLAADRLPAEPE